jgi:hypothetical protein
MATELEARASSNPSGSDNNRDRRDTVKRVVGGMNHAATTTTTTMPTASSATATDNKDVSALNPGGDTPGRRPCELD